MLLLQDGLDGSPRGPPVPGLQDLGLPGRVRDGPGQNSLPQGLRQVQELREDPQHD